MKRTTCSIILICVAGCGVEGDPSGTGGDDAAIRAEFEEIARKLRAGSDAYFGERKRQDLIAALDRAATDGERLVLLADLVYEQLKLGDNDAALQAAEEACTLGRGLGDAVLARLQRIRGLVHLRRAEIANCIQSHNAQCCIYPLAGGGIHAEPESASLARADYSSFLDQYPDDLGARWLLNIAAMATGDYPAGVPEGHVVPLPAAAPVELEPFVDIAPELGLDALNLCGGVVVEDFDGDGRPDVLTSTSDPSGPLLHYRNRGAGDFEDVSEVTGVTSQLGGLNCVAGDYDGDGDADVLVLRGAWLHENGRIRNSLLRNDGPAGFRDVTRAAGLAAPARPTQAACWGDFDLDGDLDLYVGNESRIETQGVDSHPSQLFRNDGAGTFTDVAAEAGVLNDRFCKGVAVGDYDNDGDLDLYVSNVGSNRLYRNDGGLRFTDVATELGVALPHRTFACWFFDYDNDGWLDLFVTSYDTSIDDVAADQLGLALEAHAPALLRNERGTFRDVADEAGLLHAWAPMGANFGDIDNDGWLDVYLATGDPLFESLMPNVMLRNALGRRFDDVTVATGLGHLQKGHGVAFADLDGDGDQDIFHQLGGFYPGDRYANALFRNPGNKNRRVTLVLEGVESPRTGHGARIRLVVGSPAGAREIHRAVGCVSSFGGSPVRQEIGIGDAPVIERIEVTWPVSRSVQVFEDVEPDRTYHVVEFAGELRAGS